MWKRWSVAAVLLLATGAVFGQSRGAVIKQAESSMLVKGAVEIDAAGKLEKMEIDDRETLPTAVVAMLEKASHEWVFKPTIRDGRAVRAKGPMTVRFVARKIDRDHFSLQIRDATFGSDGGRLDEVVKSTHMQPPHFPEAAARAGAGGSVYLLLRVGADGKVEDVAAEQTNLTVAGTESEMKALRKIFEKASLAAARTWAFAPPTSGSAARDGHWVVRVPVDFSIGDALLDKKYGVWRTYIPGPRAIVPWVDRDRTMAGGDALGDGGLYQLGSGPQLLTPLGPPG